MGSKTRDRREQSAVRRYLEHLADSRGSAAPGHKSLDDVASHLNCESEKLRSFRDGNDAALPKEFVGAFATLLGKKSAGMNGVEVDDLYADPSSGGWYGRMLSEATQRLAKFRTFNVIDRTRPEAHQALSAYADLGVTGNVGETGRHGGGYEPVVYDGAQATREAIAKDADNINRHLFPDDQKWSAFRGVAKFGNQYGEIGLGRKGGRYIIDRFEPRHARTMHVHREDDGSFNPNKAFRQEFPGSDPAWFPAWKVAHFKNCIGWGDLYGESVFDCLLRSWMQIESMEAGLIVRRLERASLKLKHVVDIGLVDGGEEAVVQHISDYKQSFRRRKTVDNGRNMRTQEIAIPGNEDVYIGKRDKESVADITTLSGDEYIENIGDFLHFHNKYLAGLGPPKSHLGYSDASSKTGVNDLHIVFARKVRAMQLHFIRGLNHLYWVSLILRGIDPRSVRYLIFPPSLGTRDELIRSQVQLAHATTIQYLAKAFGTTGKQPSVKWFLRYIMGLDDEVVESLELEGMMDKVIQPAKGAGGLNKNDPPAKSKEHAESVLKAGVLLANPFVLEKVEGLEFLLAERAIARRLPSAVERFKKETLTAPFRGATFDRVVRQLGIRELRRAA